MIKWQESYSTGIAKLDEQHRNLFKYCNDLEDAMNDGNVSKGFVELALKFLERYAVGHFGQEEACMYKYNCPIANINQLAHKEFIETYTTYKTKINGVSNFEPIVRELHSFLEIWLRSHICTIDVKLKPCVG